MNSLYKHLHSAYNSQSEKTGTAATIFASVRDFEGVVYMQGLLHL